MMPTQMMARAVAMATYRGARLDHFGGKLLSRHSLSASNLVAISVMVLVPVSVNP
jgi:hypothetical protein